MKVTKHGSYTYKLTRLGLMNCFLVEADLGLILIDANLPGSAASILSAASDIGKPIEKICITHAHSDHVGSVDELVKALPNVELITSERSAAYMRGDFTLPADDSGTVKESNFPKLNSVPTKITQPGEKVGPLLMVSSPGHTRDHISWFDERDNTIYCGDSWQSAGGVAVMGDTRWLFPLPALVTWSKQVSLRSAAETLSLNPQRLCSGHGKVVENALPIMQAAYERAQAKIS